MPLPGRHRDAQFHYVNASASAALAENEPVISVDTKKKELVGNFKNGGREYRPTGDPEKVRVHDFLIKELGRAVPYGVYDLAANAGWVNLGIDHDTAWLLTTCLPDPKRRRAPEGARSVFLLYFRRLNGRSERIRTSDPCLPKAVLYQAELHSDNRPGLITPLPGGGKDETI